MVVEYSDWRDSYDTDFSTIQRVYVTGRDPDDTNNTFDMVDLDGLKHVEGIYVNDSRDVDKFRAGVTVEVVYVLDELKADSLQGGKNYSNIVLEIYIIN